MLTALRRTLQVVFAVGFCGIGIALGDYEGAILAMMGGASFLAAIS